MTTFDLGIGKSHSETLGRVMASVFGGIEIAPPIEVFNLTAQYNEDNHPQKVNLGVGGKVKVKGMVGMG